MSTASIESKYYSIQQMDGLVKIRLRTTKRASCSSAASSTVSFITRRMSADSISITKLKQNIPAVKQEHAKGEARESKRTEPGEDGFGEVDVLGER